MFSDYNPFPLNIISIINVIPKIIEGEEGVNLKCNSRLVERSSSSPVTHHQKAEGPVSFSLLFQPQKLCYWRNRAEPNKGCEHKIESHGFAQEKSYGWIWVGWIGWGRGGEGKWEKGKGSDYRAWRGCQPFL